MASSMRRPSRYGNGMAPNPPTPGMFFGCTAVSNATYFAREVGCTFSSSVARGKPSQGMTIDHASTQRSR